MSRFNAENLSRLGNQMTIPIEADEDGYVGRECPAADCLGYFKITLGTGIQGPAPCYCPYCGHKGESNTFFTQEQIEYAKSIVLKKITDALHQDLKSLEFEHKPKGLFGIGLSLTVKASPPLPIRYYREKQLETEVICGGCTLRYAIYGVFGWCPDCGIRNSFQILKKNLELASKELALTDTLDKDMADYLIGDSLKNVVSSFDGFGREICANKGADIQFQNLVSARRRVHDTFAFDFANTLEPNDWAIACRVFQKRHLLAHKMGVVDEEYLKKANDPQAILGRKISIAPDEVTATIKIIQALGKQLFDCLHSNLG
jgi:hypothetical protein